MANDLTGQNIQDSYKRVLTVGDDGLMYDGTGSLYTPLSASHEITTELSSSHAVNADTASFATNFTASGDISSSGTITAEHFHSSDDFSVNDGGKYFLDQNAGDTYITTGLNNNTIQFVANDTVHATINSATGLNVNGAISSSGAINTLSHITASGDISASAAGTVSAGSGSFHVLKGDTTAATGLEVSGYISATNITASGDISASGTLIGGALQVTPTDTSEDTNHYVTFQKNGNNLTNVTNGFSFNPNTDRLTIGGLTHIEGSTGNITASGNISASGNLMTNNSLYVNGKIYSDGDQIIFYDDDSTLNLSGTGGIQLGTNVNMHVTASGNISSSGTIEGSSISSDAAYYAGGYRVIYNLGNDVYLGYSGGNQTAVIQGSNITLDAPVTASIISASGNVTADKIYLQNEVNPLGNYLEWDGTGLHYKGSSHINGNITASGNISASGDLYASDYFDKGTRISELYDLTPAGTISSSLQTLGNITASGDISSSGTVRADLYQIQGTNVIDYESSTSEHLLGANNYFTKLRSQKGIEMTAPVTASGNISASGDVYASNLILPPDGEIAPSENHGTIKFMTKPPGTTNNGETVTIGQDLIEFKASPDTTALKSYLKLQPVNSGQSEIIFNDNNQDIDFIIKGVHEKTFQLNAEWDMFACRNHLGIASGSKKWPTSDYTSTGVPDKQLMVNGLTHLTGSVEIIGPITTHITASGNISSSGDIIATPQLQYNTSSISTTGNVQGDIIKFGNTTTVAGAIYAHTGSGWVLAHSGSLGNASSSLGLATGTNSTTDGMLLRGMANIGYDPGGNNGCALYLEAPGSASSNIPSTSGHVSRVVAWNYGSDTIYFNPDNTWVDLS